MQRAADLYVDAVEEERRLLDRAFLACITVDTDREDLTLATPWAEIAKAATALRNEPVVRYTRRRSQTNPEPIFSGRGSSMTTLVELRGFEPLTPCMPCKCATSCATAPEPRA
jgi:site-specific DNA recombinase